MPSSTSANEHRAVPYKVEIATGWAIRHHDGHRVDHSQRRADAARQLSPAAHESSDVSGGHCPRLSAQGLPERTHLLLGRWPHLRIVVAAGPRDKLLGHKRQVVGLHEIC